MWESPTSDLRRARCSRESTKLSPNLLFFFCFFFFTLAIIANSLNFYLVIASWTAWTPLFSEPLPIWLLQMYCVWYLIWFYDFQKRLTFYNNHFLGHDRAGYNNWLRAKFDQNIKVVKLTGGRGKIKNCLGAGSPINFAARVAKCCSDHYDLIGSAFL